MFSTLRILLHRPMRFGLSVWLLPELLCSRVVQSCRRKLLSPINKVRLPELSLTTWTFREYISLLMQARRTLLCTKLFLFFPVLHPHVSKSLPPLLAKKASSLDLLGPSRRSLQILCWFLGPYNPQRMVVLFFFRNT